MKIQDILRSKSTREWSLVLAILFIGGATIYGAVVNEIIFRIVAIAGLIGFSYSVHRKLNQLNVITSRTSEEDELIRQTKSVSPSDIELKEIELEKVDLDRTMILEELFKKASLNEAEKQQYRSKIKEKDTEMSGIMSDLLQAKNRIQQVFLDTKKYFIKDNPMKEVATSLDSDLAINGDMYGLNKEIHSIKRLLTAETIQSLEANSYVDQQFNLTRNGYKALLREFENEHE
ncbi:hypothetical protein [Bacillus solitudinis]|uniref:hypothetical protein n=1 Tax=Bacillus solitudinis TaxID=2014074 RepID=UPI000C232216|nr:hypothetical protein [Bacillus solitudinis]